MLFGCGSNGVNIAAGAQGDPGYLCLYGSDYEYASGIIDDPILTNDYILKDDLGNDLKVTLSAGYWVVKVHLIVKNTDIAAGKVNGIIVRLNGGALNVYGSSISSTYVKSAVDGNTFTIYEVMSITKEIVGSAKDVDVKVTLGVGAGTYIATSRSIMAYKITSYSSI